MSNLPIREMIHNCVKALGGKATYGQIINWVKQNYGDVNEATIRAQTIACSVNQPSRVYYPENSKPRDSDKRYDLFFSVGRGEVELYDSLKHGNWGIMNYDNRLVISHDGKPIREFDTFVSFMTFADLEKYIQEEMEMQENYQPVVIKTLVENGGRSSKELIRKVLEDYNQPNPTKSMFYTVLDVLKDHNIIREEGDKLILNTNGQLSDNESRKIIDLCNQKIEEFKNKSSAKDKIAICWPTDDDDKKIDAFIDVIKQNGKALWGVNWNAPRIQKNDFPIKGYLYYRRKIIAIATIHSITDTNSTSQYELSLKPENVDYSNNRYSNYLHIHELKRCDPFPHTILQLMDPNRQMPDVVQQRVYVKELQDTKVNFNVWIWSVTAENWEIVKEKKIWASKIRENIRTRIRPRDKVIFYVLGTGQFQGIFEFDGDWYDAPEPVWSDETNLVIYPSQIKLKLIKLGHVNVYDIASKLGIFPKPEDKKIVNLVLKGEAGYPSNNGKPIPYEDYLILLDAMKVNYLLLRHSPDEEHKWRDELGKKYHFSKIANYTKLVKGSKAIWYDREEGKYYFWGYGDVDDIIQDANGDFLAIFDNFESFVPPKESTDSIREKIEDSPGYNIQSSILEINEDLYDEIVGNKITFVSFDDEPLSIPTKDELGAGYTKISEELLIPEEKITEIVTALASGRHVLLAGPIGTGKTELARKIPTIFWEKYGGYYSEDHTATADWNTQDVIGGIFPKMNKSGQPIYEIQNGCVVDTVQKNWLNGVNGGSRIHSQSPSKVPPYRGTWLIIDEFNRADIDKAFGQLFTALRTHTLKIPTDVEKISYKTLKIPQDYRIIGTLNTADKHYLFQLSDALKSRFAYIEIDIPKKEQFEQEIYYAMKNALSDLVTNDYENFVVLNNQAKKINKEQTTSEFYSRIYQAYHFLDSVRIFKRLGTAILKLVYQNLLVGTKMTGNSKIALDNALTSNLIPQLENLSQSEIGAIHALYSDSIVKYFQDAYKNPNRQSYVNALTAVLEYLQVPNAVLVAQFANGNLNVEDIGIWRPLQTAYDVKKQEFELQLDQLKQSMEDLIETMVV